MAYEEFIVTARSDQSRAASRQFAYRLAENFFRRWPLYVLPLVLLIGIGVFQAKRAKADYKASGVINVVNNPLLTSLTSIQGSDIGAFETPAGGTARMINELLQTDAFISTVVKDAGLDQQFASGYMTPEKIRSAVAAVPQGDRLLNVTAVWPTGADALALAQGTISGYTKYVLESKVGDSTEAAQFWENQAALDQKKVDKANDALNEYLTENPPPANGADRPVEEQLALGRLNNDISQAQALVTNDLSEQQKANLTAQQLTSAAGQGLQVVDPPEMPTSPESIKRKQALVLGIYALLGFIIAVTMLVLGNLLDRTVRSAHDIQTATGLSVVATVPKVRNFNKPRSASKARPKRQERVPASL
jgi:capsular polysaccharide biosynthesis protein